MSVLDWFRPKKEVPKQGKRNFGAARINRLTSDWATMPRPANAQLRYDLPVLIARARELAKNDDYVRRFLQLAKCNVVGPTGISIQSRAVNNDGNPDMSGNAGIEAAFAEWARPGMCELTGMLSWVQCQNMALETTLRDGEVFVRMWQGADVNRFGMALEFVDPMRVDHRHNEELRNGNKIHMGVEVDRRGRPVAYHLRPTPKDISHYYEYSGPRERVPANEMLHIFLPELIDQNRGYSPMVSAMLRLQMLKGYEEAELVAARTGAAKMGFFERNEDGVGFQGDEVDEMGDIEMDAEPGSLTTLPNGVKFTPWDPSHPTTAYGEFVKSVLRGVASGLGVSYNSLANDLEGVNFSSIRAGVLEDREAWKAMQHMMIERFCRPVYERWVNMALMRGAIQPIGATGMLNPLPYTDRNIVKFSQASYQGRRWAWVDPMKDIQAAEKAVMLGVKSLSSIIRDMGGEPEDVWQEIRQERARMQELGVTPQETLNALANE